MKTWMPTRAWVRGFTLIESAIMAVGLGLVATTTVPKINEINTQSHIERVQRAALVLQAKANKISSDCRLDPHCDLGLGRAEEASASSTNSGVAGGIERHLVAGFPAAVGGASEAGELGGVRVGIADLVQLDGFDVVAVNPTTTEFRLKMSGQSARQCLVRYTQASQVGAPPPVTVLTSGC